MSSRETVTVMWRSQALRSSILTSRSSLGCSSSTFFCTLFNADGLIPAPFVIHCVFVIVFMRVRHCKLLSNKKERVMGFEPTTTTLATSCSTN